MNEWIQYQDVWVFHAKIGRYVIRRNGRGSKDFRLWLNWKSTSHWGSVEDLKAVVERIRAVHDPEKERQGKLDV